jgi:hypothetical protein
MICSNGNKILSTAAEADMFLKDGMGTHLENAILVLRIMIHDVSVEAF